MRVYDNAIRAVNETSYNRGSEVEVLFEDGRALVIKAGEQFSHPDGGVLVELISDTSESGKPPAASETLSIDSHPDM